MPSPNAKAAARAFSFGVVLFLLGARPGHTQTAVTSLSPASETPPSVSNDLTVNWRSRAERWDWFEGSQGNSRYAFGHSQLRVAFGQKRDRFDWLFEGEGVAILGLPRDAVAPPPLGQLGLGATYYVANDNRDNNASAFIKQAFVNLKHLGPVGLKVGRFEFFDGAEANSSDPVVTTVVQTRIAHRLISNFGFTAVQRSFDGAQLAWNTGANNVTAFASRPTEGIFQVNGMGELDIQIYYGAYNRSIETSIGGGSLRAFGIGYVDTRSSVLKTDNRSAAARSADRGDIRIGTWGVDYVQALHTDRAGTFDVLGWGVVQTGAWGNLTHRAFAAVGEAGWQSPTSRVKPWISAGYSYGSGDSDPNDSRHGTFFQLLTTPRQYARFPFYNMMNNVDIYATVNLRPSSRLGLRTELHGLRLAQAADLWYLGGGAFQSSTFGYQGRPSSGSRALSTVWDVSGDYQLTRVLSLTAYYAQASAARVISGVYATGHDGQLAYLETILHF
jgi:hypothetical protein